MPAIVEVRRSCQPFPEDSELCDLQSAASEEADSAAGRRSWKGRESAQRRLEFQNPAQRTHVAAAMHQQARISPCKTLNSLLPFTHIRRLLNQARAGYCQFDSCCQSTSIQKGLKIYGIRQGISVTFSSARGGDCRIACHPLSLGGRWTCTFVFSDII